MSDERPKESESPDPRPPHEAPDPASHPSDLTRAEKRFGPFAYVGFTLYWTARFLNTFAIQVISVAVGWLIYDLTRDPLMLGYAGLVQFLPSLLLVLVTGQVADRFSRRGIMALCMIGELTCVSVLLITALSPSPSLALIFVSLTGIGVARAFIGPASQALAPNLVPLHMLSRALALNSSSWQIASIVGPAIGGLLYGISAMAAFSTAVLLLALATILTLLIAKPPRREGSEPADWTAVVAGFKYVWNHKLVLGAISLDLFAVLLAGATALLPVYARDILEVGPVGLGLLRAAPGIGAVAVALLLVLRPINSNAGLWMFGCVAGFGVSTAAFGLSVSPWFSIVMLMIVGATDMVSVYVREILIQLATPDHVRGRVNAVNMMFIGASNELGEFRAGVSAAFFGPVAAVVAGGVGAVFVAGIWSSLFPGLRKAQRLDQPLVDETLDKVNAAKP